MKISSILLALPLVALLAGCGGGGGTGGGGGFAGGGGPPPPTPTPTPTPPLVPAALYVSNFTGNSVTVYPLSTTGGNQAPSRMIVGAATQLDAPEQQHVDPFGFLYVVNEGRSGSPSVVEFGPTANANATPIRQITCTCFASPQALTVDTSGNIYVGDETKSAIFVFSPSANGPSSPVRTITGAPTQVQVPEALAIASNGDLYVADFASQALLVFAPGASVNTPPKAEITGPDTGLANGPEGVSFDQTGNIWATTFTVGAVLEFPANFVTDQVPIKNITGSSTGLDHTNGVAVDPSSGNLFVGHGMTGCTCVFIFSPSQDGNEAPSNMITGAQTQLDGPFYVSP